MSSVKMIGQCVYCGATENLSDEHVVPEGLEGNMILKKASCPTCAAMTSKLERVFLREMLPLYRYYHRIKGKKKKRIGQDSMWVDVNGAKLLAEKDDLPMLVSFPVFCGPKQLGRYEPFDGIEFMLLSLPPKNRFANPLGIEVELSFDARVLARSLAKMAHCAVFLHYPRESFRPLLLPLITGEDVDLNDWVGTEEGVSGSNYHWRLELTEQEHGGKQFIVVHVWLLAWNGKVVRFWLPAAEKRKSTG